MSLDLLLHYLLLNMFRMLVHPYSGACDLLWIYFMGCTALVRCVVWYVMVWYVVCYPDALLQPASRYHTTPAKPQRNTNTHRTRAIQHMK